VHESGLERLRLILALRGGSVFADPQSQARQSQEPSYHLLSSGILNR
jgi:hypothetical protein